MRKTISLYMLLLMTVITSMAQTENLALTFANAKITDYDKTYYYEVDVIATRTAKSPDFKLGDFQFYFNYNTAAFGMNISDATVDFEYSEGSILAETNNFAIYASPQIICNTNGIVSIAVKQILSAGSMATNNITATPAVLGHLKIGMIDIKESSDICFNTEGSKFDDQNFTACGPFTPGAATSNCLGVNDGIQIIDYDGSDCSDATIDLSEENYSSLKDSDNIKNPTILKTEEKYLESISLYPNPIQNILNINSPSSAITNVELFDLRGSRIKSVAVNFKSNYQIDLSRMEAAVYFIQIATENGMVTKRVMKR